MASSKGYDDAIDDASDALDTAKTGKLERIEIQAFIQAAAANTKLNVQVGGEVIETAVDALIHDAGGSDDDDFITRRQFRDIFNRHPDMLIVFEDGDLSIKRLKQLLAHPGKVKRCFFYWTVRSRDSFELFHDLVENIFGSDKTNMQHEHITRGEIRLI